MGALLLVLPDENSVKASCLHFHRTRLCLVLRDIWHTCACISNANIPMGTGRSSPPFVVLEQQKSRDENAELSSRSGL